MTTELMSNGTAASADGAAQPGMPILTRNVDPSLSSEDFFVSNPWKAEVFTLGTNREAVPNSQTDGAISPTVVKSLSVDVARQNIRVHVLQRWTGKVERLVDDRFVAIIHDMTTPTNPVEEVELEVSEVSKGDRSLIAEGAVFYWSIAYRDTRGGQRERIASIRFARQPMLNERDIQDIFNEANEMVDFLESV